jgi:hypothetical protein
MEAIHADHERSAPATRTTVSLAGEGVELRLAGPGLEPLVLPPLRHLERDGLEPRATVRVLSTPSLGEPFPWSDDDVIARGDVRGFSDGRFRTAHDRLAGVITAIDSRERAAVCWFADPAHAPWHERAAPLRTAFHWSLTDPRTHLVHAGAVVGRSGAVLLVGPGGSGKSTLALACLAAGLDYLGDDYVLTAAGGTVHSLYATAKVTEETLRLLPELRPAALTEPAGEAKAVIDVLALAPERVIRSAPALAVVAPRLGGDEARLRPARAAEGLLAVAPSTVFQLPERSGAALQALGALVRATPVHTLELGPSLPAAVELVAELAGGAP